MVCLQVDRSVGVKDPRDVISICGIIVRDSRGNGHVKAEPRVGELVLNQLTSKYFEEAQRIRIAQERGTLWKRMSVWC